MSAESILAAVTAQGLKIRELKTGGADKAALKPEIDALLQLKAQYKDVTGEDVPGPAKKEKKKGKAKAAAPAAAPAPAAAAAPAGGAGADLIAAAAKQGEVVRAVKADKGAKSDEFAAALKELLAIKEKYVEATGEPFPAPAKKPNKKDKKAAAAAPTAAKPKEEGSARMSKAEKKAIKEKEKAEKKAANAAKKKAEQDAAAARRSEGSSVSEGKYGEMPLLQSATRTYKVYSNVSELSAARAGETVLVRARAEKVRQQGKKMCFFKLRRRVHSVQALISVGAAVSPDMIAFCGKIPPESVLDVTGTLVAAPEATQTTQSDVELHITEIHIVSKANPKLPLQLADAARVEGDKGTVDQKTRLDNRYLDLRTSANQAIFRVQAGVCRYFREYLTIEGFQEIHSPKIIPAAAEGGANVFTLGYFGGQSFLAQSPQLYKQMAINADFDRVFEIAPVFRAEDSNTHRHLTEFCGLDMEMAFNEHYHEVLDVLEQMFVHIFKQLQKNLAHEIKVVAEQFPREPFEFLEPTLRLEWPEAIAMLREAGEDIDDFEDLSTPMEKRLGDLVKAKYHTDFYILDKFPLCIRPFYTMPDPSNPLYSNSYDIMMRGEEIMSGAQRIHDYDLLKKMAMKHEVPLHTIQDYLDSFEFGSFPHAGGGVGMERVVMLFLGLPNIRKTSMFPRDPSRCTP